MRQRAASIAAAALVAAAVAVVPSLWTSPASAAACTTDVGVTVVVDFTNLGGGIQQVCLPDGGGDEAIDLFPAAGFPLTPVTGGAGYFVCRVKGSPADEDCSRTPSEDAYWALWWADADDGRWTYSTRGVGTLTIPDGGWVGFAYDNQAGDTQPGVTPKRAPTPTQTPTPTPSPTQEPSEGGGEDPTADPEPSASPSTPASTSPSPEDTPSDTPSDPASSSPTDEPTDEPTKKPKPTASPSDTATDDVLPSPTEEAAPLDTSDPPDASADGSSPDPGGLPAWAAPLVLVVLAAGGGGAWWWRRRA